MSYLLDTNVVSERTRPQPDANVRGWLRAHSVAETYLSIITVAELEGGIVRLGNTRRATALWAFLSQLETQFTGRVLPVDRRVAHSWATLSASANARGEPLGYADALIAATARAHDLTVVTRNVKDFAATGVNILNPWEAS